MQVVETITEMKRLRRQLPEPFGFVPTMGYLHKGHISLVRYARKENASVVASIFVNPTQFGPSEDFEDYPRDTKRDLAMLEEAKTDVVFIPPATEMYPERFSSWVEVGKLTERLEGNARPTHFRGVTTICTKLFNIVEPTKAYFGQKDAQQALVIKKMVADLNMNLEIVMCPTVREPDGLAMSSRHIYLSKEQRQAAVSLYEAIQLAEELWSEGERDAEHLRQVVTSHIQQQPLAEIEYVSVADTETLEELKTATSSGLLSLVVRFGKTRLLDNTILK
ncbi:MAG: pantoate--beta-alanine ligase [Dehalococcoidales bacterium]|nr:MAG: pantoate--beta-alanine ligase [Dehalococcoidales bacterium]